MATGPTIATPETETPGERLAACPVFDLWRLDGAPALSYRTVAADAVPSPARLLLDHDGLMTGMLSGHHGSPLSVHCLAQEHVQSVYVRKVVLSAKATGQPVQIAVIRIALDRFAAPIRQQILDAAAPFGALLAQAGMVFRSRPIAFLAAEPDEAISKALALTSTDGPLYGRHSHIIDGSGVALTETIEILPPLTD